MGDFLEKYVLGNKKTAPPWLLVSRRQKCRGAKRCFRTYFMIFIVGENVKFCR